jgi:hypothetical protein
MNGTGEAVIDSHCGTPGGQVRGPISMSELFIPYCDKNGKICDRGLLSRQAFSKNDIKTVLKALREANPKIQISAGLTE